MKECSNCQWFTPIAHGEWEAKPPSYGGQGDTIERLEAWLQEKNLRVKGDGWPGKCSVSSIEVPTKTGRLCAQWEIESYDVMSLNQRVGLRENYATIRDLRLELKKERERSLKRFRALKVKTQP